MTELAEIFSSTPWLFVTCVFLLSLLIGSFLNVVIHRLPIMLDREWRKQAREILAEPAADAGGQPVEVSAAHQGDTASSAKEERFNLLVPRSRCPKCNAEIKAHQNIPVISYLLLGGKCANCGAKISPRYPIVELATAILSAAVAWRFGWHWQTLAALAFTWSLIALTVIDLDHTLLPDVITVPLLWLGRSSASPGIRASRAQRLPTLTPQSSALPRAT
jgi:leader peptidase (prepilin peptidase)/N-methyltransferase